MHMPACCRPFWDNRVNALDFICCLSITLNCLATLYFNDKTFIATSGAQKLDGIIVAVHIFAIIAIFVVFTWTSIENHFKTLSVVAISKRVGNAVIKLQKAVIERRDEVLSRLEKQIEARSDKHSDSPVEEQEVTFEQFKIAIQSTLIDDNAPSETILEATFFILKLAQADDDPNDLVMSPEMREALATNLAVKKKLVPSRSCPPSAPHSRPVPGPVPVLPAISCPLFC
jgi:hypothetical protein